MLIQLSGSAVLLLTLLWGKLRHRKLSNLPKMEEYSSVPEPSGNKVFDSVALISSQVYPVPCLLTCGGRAFV
jgi:hypothetical protein